MRGIRVDVVLMSYFVSWVLQYYQFVICYLELLKSVRYLYFSLFRNTLSSISVHFSLILDPCFEVVCIRHFMIFPWSKRNNMLWWLTLAPDFRKFMSAGVFILIQCGLALWLQLEEASWENAEV